MDKKTLIGLLIVGVILFGYVFYNSKQVAKYQQEQYRADSIARAEHPERYVEEVPLSDTGKAVRDELEARQAEQARQDSIVIANIGQSLVDASRPKPAPTPSKTRSSRCGYPPREPRSLT